MITLQDTRKFIQFDQDQFMVKGKKKRYGSLEEAIFGLAQVRDDRFSTELLAFMAIPENLEKAEGMYRSENEGRSATPELMIDAPPLLKEILERKIFVYQSQVTRLMELWQYDREGQLYHVGPMSDVKTYDVSALQMLLQLDGTDRTNVFQAYGDYCDYSKGKPMRVEKWISMQISNHILSKGYPEDDLKVLTWSADNEPSQRVLDYSLLLDHMIDDTKTPAWHEFVSRLSDPLAFMSWTWSLFSGNLETRQVCWLHGGGNDGKSTIANVFAEFLGPHIVSSFSMQGQNQFTNHKFYRKRLAVAPDVKSHSLLTNDLVFRLTGGDTLDIEPKNRSSFSSKVTAHFLICSNISPIIDVFSKAYKSRLLYIQVTPVRADSHDAENFADQGFHQRLIDEMYPFLARCRQVHERHVLQGNRVPIPEQMESQIITHCKHPVLVESMNFWEDELTIDPFEDIALSELRVDFIKHLNRKKIKWYDGHFELFVNYSATQKDTHIYGPHMQGVTHR